MDLLEEEVVSQKKVIVEEQGVPFNNPEQANLNPNYQFDTYVVGNSNRFAFTAALAVAENPGKVNIIKHEYLNLAVIKFSNHENVLVKAFPKFNKNYEIGQSTCTVGFAFPEYKAFTYDEENRTLKSDFKVMNFPIFPVEGIITRNIFDTKENISMFELSSPVEDGMESAPVMNTNGEILGIVLGNKKTGNRTLSYAITSSIITKFLKENNIKYEEVNNE